MCTELAFSEGDRLASCLDLIHLPETTLWVEWSDAARQDALAGTTPGQTQDGPVTGRAGVLLTATPNGRRGQLRTFWSEDRSEGPTLAPMETYVDLDGAWAAEDQVPNVFEGGWVRISDPGDPGVDAVFDCLRFRFDPQWAAYYSKASIGQNRAQILRASLASVSRDVPMLLAFFLVLSSRNSLPRRVIDFSRLNRKRLSRGKTPLLDHVEVCAPLELFADGESSTPELPTRASPRLHRVRGHLVRRGNTVTWRKPHARGSARRGVVLSRTVTFSFGSCHEPGNELKGT
jgi:hypothetical protein